ncbi:MAG: PilN domain-containing protein [Deltaproteobacteria bacterium]|nr:PilN domain-containing protein [Deltaproteobacteria bacterium]
MISINLLPYLEKEKKANIARQLIIIVGTVGIFFLIIAFIQIYMMKSISSLQADIKTKKATLAKLTKTIGDIEKAKQDKKILELKLAAINSLEGNRLYPVQLLDEIASLVPTNNIWLENISQRGTRLQIKGVGRDNIAVSLFMKAVEMSGYISSVEIISSKQVRKANTDLQEFTLSCVLHKGK